MTKARRLEFEILFASTPSKRQTNKDGARTQRRLLRRAEEAGFDVLLTTDKNLAYQQDLSHRKIAVVLLGQNRWSLIKPMLLQIAAAIDGVSPGSYTLIRNHPNRIGTARTEGLEPRTAADV